MLFERSHSRRFLESMGRAESLQYIREYEFANISELDSFRTVGLRMPKTLWNNMCLHALNVTFEKLPT